MESLSRPFRRSNLRSFSAYDDVFSGAGGGGGGGGDRSSRVEDYKEVFGGSASSIPVLDLSALEGARDVGEARGISKKLDYSKIFGSFRDDEVPDSYEEVVARRTPAKTKSGSDGSAIPGHQKEEEYQHGKPNQSLEDMKQYNTFYSRSSHGSEVGEYGTTHVAQVRAVPGFTCFIDENVQKTGDKFGPLPKDKIRPSPKVSSEVNKKQAIDDTENFKSQSSSDKLYSVDRNVDANGSSVKTPSFKLSPPTRVPASSACETRRSGELNFKVPKSGASKTGRVDCSPSFSDEELDVDSAASVSAAALRKAVREAEASIRLAKEIMERTKNGLQKSPKPCSKEVLDMKKKKKKVEKASIQATRTETVSPILKELEEVEIANQFVRETKGAKSNSYDVHVHIIKLEKKKLQKNCEVASGFMQSEGNCIVENISGKGNEDEQETAADSKAPVHILEIIKPWRFPRTNENTLNNVDFPS